ncbi:MAG: hypothetical protein V1778_00175 [bacterium]
MIALFLISVVLVVVYLSLVSPSSGLIRVDRITASADAGTNAALRKGAVLGAATVKVFCEERPNISFGDCGMYLGSYFDGSTCRQIYGCSIANATLPFSDIGVCASSCQPAP